MKRIEVSIKPFELDAVKESLVELGIRGTTVSVIQQLASGNEPRSVYRGSAYAPDFVTMLRLEMVVPADLVQSAVDAIGRSAKSTRTEDALVLVMDAGESVRMRSGTSGDAAFDPATRGVPSAKSPTMRPRAVAWQT